MSLKKLSFPGQFTLLVCSFSLLAIGATLWSWRITTVSCRWQSHDCPPDLQEKLTATHSLSLANPQLESALKHILAAQGWQLNSWKTIPPRQLVLEVERLPAAYLIQVEGGSPWVVDISGHLYQTTPQNFDSNSVPTLHVTPDQYSQEVTDSQVKLDLHQTLISLSENPVSKTWQVKMNEVGLSANVEKYQVFFLRDDLHAATKFNLVKEQITNSEKPLEATVIDLRFRLPVVR